MTRSKTAEPARREAIDQALRKWSEADRKQRIKMAKAFLMDAVQEQADEASQFSLRVERGVEMLAEALSTGKVCPTCRGRGKVPDGA